MFCPNCGTQTETQTKFCKSCGHKLVEHARLLETPEEVESANVKDRLLRAGTGAMIGSFLVLLLSALLFGGGLIFNPDFRQRMGEFVLPLILLFLPLAPGIIGLVQLARGGYFKNFRERQLQAELTRLQEEQKALQAKLQEKPFSSLAYPSADGSITEATTRELQVPVNRIKGEKY